jgi:hypothetical protein
MKSMKPALLALVFLFLFAGARTAEAKGIPIFYSFGSEKIVKVADFPDTEDYQLQSGEYVDAGYMFKQVQIFWIPLWNYGGNYCGYVGKDDTYMEIPKAELDSMAAAAKVTLPESPSLGLWNSMGGKLIVGVLALAAAAVGIFAAKA